MHPSDLRSDALYRSDQLHNIAIEEDVGLARSQVTGGGYCGFPLCLRDFLSLLLSAFAIYLP